MTLGKEAPRDKTLSRDMEAIRYLKEKGYKSYKISEYSPGVLHAGAAEDNGYQVKRAERLFFNFVSYRFPVSDS